MAASPLHTRRKNFRNVSFGEQIKSEADAIDGKHRHWNGGAVLTEDIPARVVSCVRKKRVNASDSLRVCRDELGFAAFLKDSVHAFDVDGFKRIFRSGISHAVVDGGVVTDISDEDSDKQNDGGFIRDGENAVHQI